MLQGLSESPPGIEATSVATMTDGKQLANSRPELKAFYQILVLNELTEIMLT